MLAISVIIPALNAERTLACTLSALQNNTTKAEEILVIDGLSEDRTADIARQFGCTLITNPLRHTAAARQKGIIAAQGEIVAMTDSDCVPSREWLERVHNHFSHDPKLDGVGGPMRLNHPCSRVQAYCASKAVTGIPEREEIIIRKEMRGRFSGANCAYRRQVVIDTGGFDQRFKAHGEDIDLFWRLVDRGARLLFDPALFVEHLSFAKDHITLARKSFGYGVASARLTRFHFPQRKFDLSFYWRPWSATIREILRQDRERYPTSVFIDQFMFAMGRAWGILEGE
jgi:glycosyltransferase involved in cell wall biosynthesis